MVYLWYNLDNRKKYVTFKGFLIKFKLWVIKMYRCSWCGKDDMYIKYHDEEWGTPVFDDQKMFEFLVLESAQAGLSWRTILKRRENYRRAFDNFDVNKVADYDANRVEELMNNDGIVKNRKKIDAAINNAQRFIEVQKEFGSFCNYVWAFVDGKPIVNNWSNEEYIPANSPISDTLALDLKTRGFKFLGSTIIYSFMQATGLVNDHVTDCFRFQQLNRINQLIR